MSAFVNRLERKCCVPECNVKCTENTIFHKFPNDSNRKKEWMRACNITTEVTSGMLICGSHFTRDDYKSDPNSGLYHLKPSTVPAPNSLDNFEECSVTVANEKKIMVRSQNKRKCCVPQCNAGPDEKISLHLFPKKENLRQQWMRACGIRVLPKPYSVVCSTHFERSDYITGPTSRKQVLNDTAVPKFNLPKRTSMTITKGTKVMKNDKELIINTNKPDDKVTTIIYVPENCTKIINTSGSDLKNSKIVITKEDHPSTDNIFTQVQNNVKICKINDTSGNSKVASPKVNLNQKIAGSMKRKMPEIEKNRESPKAKQGKVIGKQDDTNDVILILDSADEDSPKKDTPQVKRNVQCRSTQKAILRDGTSAVTLCADCGQYCKIEDEDLLYKSYKNPETLAAELLLELQEVNLSNEDECILLTKKGIEICNKTIKKENINLIELLTNDNELMAFTGINFELLGKLTKLVSDVEGISSEKFNTPTKDRIVICLCKLRINLSFACLAMLFGIKQQTCASNFFSMLKTLSIILEKTIYWPKTEELLKDLPECFQSFKQTRVILNCSETPIGKQRCINCQQNLKENNKKEAIKLILGVAPSGLIIFKSSVFESQSGDVSIFTQTNILEKLNPLREAIMSDKSLNIEAECAENNITLIKLPKLGKNKQFSNHDVELIKNISTARIHVDRTLHRFKMYKIMQNKVHWRILPYLDEVCTIIAGIVNLKNPIQPNEIDIRSVKPIRK